LLRDLQAGRSRGRLVRQRATLFRGLGREKVALGAQQIFFSGGQASHPNIDNYFSKFSLSA
jgi:hypothetical protein